MDTSLEAGQTELEGCGAEGVGVVVSGKAGETVAAVDAEGVVGHAGGEAEVEVVVVLVLGVGDGEGGILRVGIGLILFGVDIAAVGSVNAEVPVHALAEHAPAHKADALEEFEAHLVEEIVFLVQFSISGEKAVETVGLLGVEVVACAGIFEAYAERVGLGLAAEHTDTDMDCG